MSSIPSAAAPAKPHDTAFAVLLALSFCHFLNDMLQSLLPAIYPVLRDTYALDFGQIGLITLSFQLTASILQPIVGWYTDRKPMPYSLAIGMASTGAGLLLLSIAHSYPVILCGAALVGTGSSIFHPESSRIARLASGGRHGFAQSVFQVGGNLGSASGPLLAAFVVAARGQAGLGWFSLVALVAIVVLSVIGAWYQRHRIARSQVLQTGHAHQALPRAQIVRVIAILLVLIFSKYFYMASLSSYYTLYLIDHFQVPLQGAQIRLFVFLGAVAAGTLLGGHVGDRIGRKTVIWFSILGMLPFTLILPHANLFWTTVLTIPIGLIMASAFPAIVVYAQELLPGKVGTIAGLFFGFAFGMGALGAALLGQLADYTSIEFVYGVCAFLPALGIFAALLPETGQGLELEVAMQAFGIRRLFALAALCFAAVAPLALAQTRTNPPYFLIDPPQNATTTDKLEVAEVFSYACIHCAQFQEHIDAWRKTLDTKKVEFVYIPSPYNAVDTLLARGYLAAKSLGVAEKTHHAVFQALHERGVEVRTLDNVVSLYTQLGVPADKMSKAVKDFFVDAEVRRTYELMLKYKIDGTPTLLVAGKYRITSDSAGGYAEMIKVADKLIAQELAQKTGTSRQAPNKGK